MLDLFPETMAHAPQLEHAFRGSLVDAWDAARVNVRLIGLWSTDDAGWRVGWFVQLDHAVDEWHPAAEGRHRSMAQYPWYRLGELPRSGRFNVAAALAARAAKIVLEQMTPYAEDEAVVADARTLSEHIDTQARAWLPAS
jgi:hypothetical protein